MQGGLAAGASLAAPAIAGGPTTLQVGYLHGLAADAHLWVAEQLGSFKEQGLAIEPTLFVTGLEAFQALAGGSVDLVTTGAVLSNFPARGVGKVFLINCEEFGLTQIWVHPEAGIGSVVDLKGRQIATSRGTTAHYLLYHVLRANGLDPANDVDIVHQQMGNAVAAFIAGAVPAVATWKPFDLAIAQSASGAVKLADGAQFPQASALNGWTASNELHAAGKDVLRRFIRAWLPANAALVDRPAEILPMLHARQYDEFSSEQLQSFYDAVRWRSTMEWLEAYRNGDVARILDRVTDFNVAVGAFADPLPAESYFDRVLFDEVVAEG